jgi:hypothetical protein
MAPYRHVANKQALLELAADVLYENIKPPDPDLNPWGRLETMLESILDLADRHPWTVDVLMSLEVTRGADTPNVERVRVLMLGLLRDVGFSPHAAVLAAETTAEVITGLLMQKKLRAPRRAAAGRSRPGARGVGVPNERDIRAFTIEVYLSGLRARLDGSGAAPVGSGRRRAR